MIIQHNEHTDEFLIAMNRSEAIDLSVFLGMRGHRGWLIFNGLGSISDELHKLLRSHPPLDACERCLQAITFVEGEWRHTETCRAYCADGHARATPKREEDSGQT